MGDRAWMDEAPCRDTDPTVFDGCEERKKMPPAAFAVCRGCTVVAQCLDYGYDEVQGVWGCTTPFQRRQIRRGLSRRKCPVCGSVLIDRLPSVEVCLACGVSWDVPLGLVVAA